MIILDISDINKMLKRSVEEISQLKNFYVKGEASNITYQARHLYFTLKNQTNEIRCAAFSYEIKNIPTDIKAGDEILVYGSINVYEKNASVQIVCNAIKKNNALGELYKRREELIRIYKEKGYFDSSIKKSLPKYPKTIGVVTAHTGAAIHDIINTTHKRNPNVDIYVYSSKVQGEGASISIANGIEYFNNSDLDIDCLIVGRGGGSIEDLWAFNEVPVIEAIYKSNIPVISAVGHEVDNLISDLVADVRAATPTQAAEILIPIKADLDRNLYDMRTTLNRELNRKLNDNKNILNLIINSYHYNNFHSIQILERYNNIEIIKKDLQKSMEFKLSTKHKKEELKNLASKITYSIKHKFNSSKMNLSNLSARLEKYDVSDLLNRGYTITLKDGKLIKDKKLKTGDIIETIYAGKKTISSEVK